MNYEEYEVVAGKRRLAALKRLAKSKDIEKIGRDRPLTISMRDAIAALAVKYAWRQSSSSGKPPRLAA